MDLHDFIFTNKKPKKYFRHIAFWLFQFAFWTFWADIFFCTFEGNLYWTAKYYGLFFLDITYTYLIAYSLTSKYLIKKQPRQFFLSIFLLTIVLYVVNVVYHLWVFGYLQQPGDVQLLMSWFFSIDFIIMGPPVICAMFITLKMLKNLYAKMEEKQVLTKANANAELQLLQSQVHPHFLFNTLNNIYSFSLTNPSKAASLVLKLADTLKYMIYDCEKALVPLEKELQLLRDYMGLEKVRYGNRLDMQIEINGKAKNKTIAPLLMIPFVENSFKHGTSQMLEHPWIKLQIEIDGGFLLFELSNSKPFSSINKNGKGIGLANVQKRLQLIYPGEHHLQITSTEDNFLVRMQLMLFERVIPSSSELIDNLSSVKTYAYA